MARLALESDPVSPPYSGGSAREKGTGTSKTRSQSPLDARAVIGFTTGFRHQSVSLLSRSLSDPEFGGRSALLAFLRNGWEVRWRMTSTKGARVSSPSGSRPSGLASRVGGHRVSRACGNRSMKPASWRLVMCPGVRHQLWWALGSPGFAHSTEGPYSIRGKTAESVGVAGGRLRPSAHLAKASQLGAEDGPQPPGTVNCQNRLAYLALLSSQPGRVRKADKNHIVSSHGVSVESLYSSHSSSTARGVPRQGLKFLPRPGAIVVRIVLETLIFLDPDQDERLLGAGIDEPRRFGLLVTFPRLKLLLGQFNHDGLPLSSYVHS